jgi:hypothetical protein
MGGILLVSKLISFLYVLVIGIMLSPYVVFTWGVGDTDGAIIIVAVYLSLALFILYITFRDNKNKDLYL